MLISVCMMCFGSLVIACLPGYAVIGTGPRRCCCWRVCSGLSVGGEYGTSATYMSEVAVEGKKGFYASFQYVTLIGGQLLAVLVVVALQQVLSDEDLHAGDGVFLCPRGGTGYRRAVAASPAGRNLEARDPGAERGWLI